MKSVYYTDPQQYVAERGIKEDVAPYVMEELEMGELLFMYFVYNILL